MTSKMHAENLARLHCQNLPVSFMHINKLIWNRVSTYNSFLASNPSVKSPLHTQNQLTHQNFVEYLFSNRFCRRFQTDSHVIQTQFKYLMVATTLLTAANHANLPIICRLLCRRCVSRSSSSILLNGSAHSLDSQFLALCERIHR